MNFHLYLNWPLIKPLNLTIIVLVVASCATPTTTMNVQQPARQTSMQGTRSIAVLEFKSLVRNRSQLDFRGRLEGTLASIRVNNTPHFNLVDRVTLENIIKEQRITESDSFDARTATRIGKLIAADTIFTGSYKFSAPSSHRYSEQRRYCAATDKDSECTRWSNRTISCNKRSLSFSFTAKAVNVETGNIRYSKTYPRTSETSYCSDAQQRLSDDQLLNAAIEHGLNDFRKDVAPYRITVTLDFMKSDKTKFPPDVKSDVDFGMKMVNDKRIDLACIKFENALTKVQSPAVLYNNGVCAEVNGDKDRAASFYDAADKLQFQHNESYWQINQAVHRIKGGAPEDAPKTKNPLGNLFKTLKMNP